jgi:hypothetical protein
VASADAGSFLADAPTAWVEAMAVWRQLNAASSCQELDEAVRQVPVPPASSPGSRHNATIAPFFFSAASMREQALGC